MHLVIVTTRISNKIFQIYEFKTADQKWLVQIICCRFDIFGVDTKYSINMFRE